MPASQTNKELADLFQDAAKILDLKGDNAFKAIAFRKVATLLDNMPDDVKKLHSEGGTKKIEAVKGIGKSSAAIIVEYIEEGRSTDYEELALSVPGDLLKMLDVPGMGPKTVKLVWQEKGIETLSALAEAIEDGSLADLKGLGKKKLEQIKDGLTMREAASQRRSLGTAVKVARGLLEEFGKLDGVDKIENAGSVRRGKETIGDLDFLLTTKPKADAVAMLKRFSEFPQVKKVLVLGDTKCSVLTHDDLQVDCRVVPPTSFGAALIYFTGSKEHNRHIRSLAAAKGHNLNEWGIFDAVKWEARDNKPGTAPTLKPVAGKTEEEVYRWLGMQWVPPELREDTGEIEAAQNGELPELIAEADYRGDLHCHTTESDGIGSIAEMAEAAKALGYKFLAITDHSKGQAQANGLDAKRLLKHIEAIHAANDQIKGIELLAGSEVDILADGSLDYEDEVLAELDWVVASPHAALRQDTEKATERLLKAIDNPYVNVIGHPTGRLINARAGLPLDFGRIFEAAAKTGTALEINASYQRLDLSAENAKAAVAVGCMLSINTDAHSPDGLGKLSGGLANARRGWVTKKNVINCMTLSQLKKFIAAKR